MYYACALGLVDCAGVREHLIPRAREPRPIVNSGRVVGGGAWRGQKRVTEGIFLAKIFFTVLTLLTKRIASMDLAQSLGKSRERIGGGEGVCGGRLEPVYRTRDI